MILENLEKQLEVAKKLQAELSIKLMQREQAVRSNLHTYMENGLSLLGKGIIWGRKMSESFAAQNHRRADVLKKTEEAFDHGNFEAVTEEDLAEERMSVAPEDTKDFSRKQLKKMNRKSVGRKTNMRDRRVRAHSNGATRTH